MYELFTTNELLCEALSMCYCISRKSVADVFFNYSPHCDAYSICYYLEGWTEETAGEMVWMDSVVTIKRNNLINTLAKLTALATELGVL